MIRMSKITPDLLIGAVVEEVDADGECIQCIHLKPSDGRYVDVVAYCDNEDDGSNAWMEVM